MLRCNFDIEPRYGRKAFARSELHNRFQTVVAPEPSDRPVWLNQDAWFSLGNVDAGRTLSYSANRAGDGLYLFVIEGQVEVADEALSTRDGIRIGGAAELTVGAPAWTAGCCRSRCPWASVARK